MYYNFLLKTDPLAKKTYLEVVPECHIPFNWHRPDKDQLLCVLIKDVPDCCWSGGFKIDQNDSMHINVRYGKWNYVKIIEFVYFKFF